MKGMSTCRTGSRRRSRGMCGLGYCMSRLIIFPPPHSYTPLDSTKLQPHHLPLLLLYTCSLYILTRPDLGHRIARFFSVSTPASVAAVSQSILPQWVRSHLPNEFPFAVPDKDDPLRSPDHAHTVLEPQLLSQAGQALISILSMVTGLLLSYKSSSALGKWEKGKGVWIGAGAGAGGMSGGVKGEIRSAVRMVCQRFL